MMTAINFITFVIALFRLFELSCSSEAEFLLYKQLLNDYNPLVRPVRNASEPLKITIRVILQQIITVNEQDQVIELNAWLKYVWKDHYLSWDPNEHQGIGDVRIPGDRTIWMPDVLLYNSADEKFDSTFHSNLVVYSSGEIHWIPPGILRSSCKMDITWFPFDDQICFLKFGSWTYNGNKIDLQIDSDEGKPPQMDLSEYIPSSEWSLVDVFAAREVLYYVCCPEPYPTAKFYLRIRRRTLYYGINLIIPSLLISIMTLLAFCLPPHDMSEKIGFQTTILLSVCFFLTIVSDMTPHTSEAVPLLGVFFSTLTLIVSISTAFTITVLNLRYRQPQNCEMTPVLKTVFLVWLPWFLMMHRPGYVLTKKEAIKLKKDEEDLPEVDIHSNGIEEHFEDTEKWMRYTAKDRLTLQRKVGDGIFFRRRPTNRRTRKTTFYNQRIQKCMDLLTDKSSPDHDESMVAILLSLGKVHSRLAYITGRMERKADISAQGEDWKFASMAVDRLCLFLFSAFLIISVCGILFSAPYLHE